MNDDCSDKMTGVCKWFDKMRGYGFIQELSTGNDFFVHYSQLQSDNDNNARYLVAGEYIEFLEVNNPQDNNNKENCVVAGHVTGIGGGPLMYQSHLKQHTIKHRSANSDTSSNYKKKKRAPIAYTKKETYSDTPIISNNTFGLLSEE